MTFDAQILDLLNSLETQISKELPTEWAEKNRILTSDVTAFPGKMSYERFPFWREPVNNLSPDHPMRIQAIMGGAQIGKSTCFIETGIGYLIKNHPAPMVMTLADKEMADISVTKKIDQMLQNSGIAHLIRANTLKKNNKRSGDTKDMKEFPGGSLAFFSIKSVDKIGRQNSYKYGFFDDLEAAARAQKFAGDILDLLFMRFNSYKDTMKISLISTPEIKQTSITEYAFNQGDQRYFMMPCPLCGAYIKFIWYEKLEGSNEHVGVHFEKDDHGKLIENTVGYICQECKGYFKESHKKEMLHHGQWQPTATPSRDDWFSYHISGLYAPPGFFNWTHYAGQWIKIFPGDKIVLKQKLQVFLNLVLGQTYEEIGRAPKINQLAQNTRPYKIGEIPCKMSESDGNGKIVMLTCACDLNGYEDDGRLDYEVIAHSETGNTYSIDAGSIGTFQRGIKENHREKWTYRNNEPVNNIWNYFHKEVLQRVYKADTGRNYYIFIAGVDTGALSKYAYPFIEQAAKNGPPIYIVGIKGDTDKVRKYGVDTDTFRKSKEKDDLYILEVNQLKDTLADRVELIWDEGSSLTQPFGFMNFPNPSDDKYTYKGYFMQFESELKTPKLQADGAEIGYVWKKRHSGVMNHFWDCNVYSIALRDLAAELFLKNTVKTKDISWNNFCKTIRAYVLKE
jgi:phage terminase large subunit GpA-like protein